MRLRVLVLVVWNVVAFLVLLELGVAWLRPAPGFEAIQVHDGGLMRYALSPDPELVYVPLAGAGALNAGGYRGPLITAERTPGRRRLVFVGDSVLEGLGVQPHERFTSLLDRSLGAGVEVVNLGVRGYNLRQVAAYFEQSAPGYDPDRVVVCLCYNDLELRSGEVVALERRIALHGQGGLYRAYYRAQSRVQRWLIGSHLYRHLQIWMHRDEQRPLVEALDVDIAANELAELFARFERAAERGGFELDFVLLPTRGSRDDLDAMRAALERRGHAPLDLQSSRPERGPPGPELFLPNDPCHLSPEGHRFVAEELRRNLPGLHG